MGRDWTVGLALKGQELVFLRGYFSGHQRQRDGNASSQRSTRNWDASWWNILHSWNLKWCRILTSVRFLSCPLLSSGTAGRWQAPKSGQSIFVPVQHRAAAVTGAVCTKDWRIFTGKSAAGAEEHCTGPSMTFFLGDVRGYFQWCLDWGAGTVTAENWTWTHQTKALGQKTLN